MVQTKQIRFKVGKHGHVPPLTSLDVLSGLNVPSRKLWYSGTRSPSSLWVNKSSGTPRNSRNSLSWIQETTKPLRIRLRLRHMSRFTDNSKCPVQALTSSQECLRAIVWKSSLRPGLWLFVKSLPTDRLACQIFKVWRQQKRVLFH